MFKDKVKPMQQSISCVDVYSDTTSANHPAIALYDKTAIDTLHWPDNEESEKVKGFLVPLMKKGTDHFISNIHADILALKVDNLILPLTVLDTDYENSYVSSPYGHYIAINLEMMNFIKSNILKKFLKVMIKGLGQILKLGHINKVVIVDNWLVSTDLHPEMDQKTVKMIREYLQKTFPDHAILFRSLTERISPTLTHACKAEGFDLIASRQIFFTRMENEQVSQTRIMKSDLKALRETDYDVVDGFHLTSAELQRVLSLYKAVYLDKYTYQHPQFNEHYLQAMLDANIYHFKLLKKNGIIDGAAGFMVRDGILFCPFFGYDTSKPNSDRLYRLLSTVLFLEAKNRGLLFHQSSGASFYKSVRRAEHEIEYMAVQVKHLPFTRRFPWLLLKGVMNWVGIPFMKKY